MHSDESTHRSGLGLAQTKLLIGRGSAWPASQMREADRSASSR